MTLSEAARGYLGVNFAHQGRNPAVGIDCIGLIVLACRDIGRELVDSTDYGRNPHNGVLERHLRANFGAPAWCGCPTCRNRTAVPPLQPDAIVSIDYAGATRHLALVGAHPDGGLSLIHTNQHVGRVTEHALDARWLKRITGVYRL